MKLRLGLALVASLVFAGESYAQGTAGFRPLTSTSTATLNVTTSSSNVNANNALQALVCNIGSVEAFVAIGGSSSAAATTSGMSFPANFCTTLQLNQGNWLAAITSSSSTTLRVTFASGTGPVALGGGSGGGGGGGTSSTFGAAFPGTGTAAGFYDGTNMQGARVTSAALASAFTPPTSGLQQVQSFGMVWNGSTWDRATAASGGLSIQDQAAFTAGTSNFTPGGGVFNDSASLTSGQQGTFRMTTKRAQIMDVDTTGNALYSAITAPIPAGTNLIGDVNLRQGGTALSATNGLYSNLLQGNAALSATNGLYANQLQGNAALSATNPSFTRLTDGTNAVVTDPCQGALTPKPINISAASTTVIVAGTSAKKTYICGMMLFSAGTTNVGIVEGSGSTCGTSTLGLIGGATAGTGPNLTAQAGFASPPAGYQIAATTVNQNDICLINGSAIQVSGFIVTAVR